MHPPAMAARFALCAGGLLLPRVADAVVTANGLLGREFHIGAAGGGDPLPKGSHGEEPWPLYPVGKVPGKQIANIPAETFARADPRNMIGLVCSPMGRAAGNYYSNTAVPTLLPYLVDKSDPHFANASVVIAPGGGHDHLAFEVTGTDIARWLNTLGISAFVLKYRTPARAWEEDVAVPQMDGQRALSLVRHRAAKLGLDPSHVGLFGGSAGGDLAVRVATAARRAYARVDEADDLSFRPDFMLLLYPGVSQQTLQGAGNAPATFIASAFDDPCINVNLVLSYYNALREHGAPPSELHVYPDGRHGYGTCSMYPKWQNHAVCNWTQRAAQFMARQFHLPATRAQVQLQATAASSSTWCPQKQGGRCSRATCVGHCDLSCWERCK